MLIIRRKKEPPVRDFVFHARRVPPGIIARLVDRAGQDEAELLGDWGFGEGQDMLAGPFRRMLGPNFAERLTRAASILADHPQSRLIDENVDSRLDWLRRSYPPSRNYEMVYDAFVFYRDVFGMYCPEMYPAFFSLLEAESVLYAELRPKPYREHLAHPVFVFLAGRRILDNPDNLSEITDITFSELARHADFVQQLGERLPSPTGDAKTARESSQRAWNNLLATPWRTQRVVQLAWIVASLCHDLGYPAWHAAERAFSSKSDVLPLRSKPAWSGTPQLKEFVEGSLFFSDLRRRHKEYTAEQDLLNEVTKSVLRNHSFASALTVLATLREILERATPGLSRDPDEILDMVVAWELAAAAVALHDIDTPKKAGNVRRGVTFEETPLAWLLTTMDTLQEWDRPLRRLACDGAEYLIPFEGVAVRVEQNRDGIPVVSSVKRLVNRELVEKGKSGPRILRSMDFCAAHWPGYWSDFSESRPEPAWGWNENVSLKVFVVDDGVFDARLCEFQCEGCDRRSAFVPSADSRFVNLRGLDDGRPHSRCYNDFWVLSIQEYLNTAGNAITLGRLLTRLVE
ncbi:MAG: hypothetical protein WBE26_12230 [Phycisphaerae bacterium]